MKLRSGIKKILVFRLSSIGDILLTTPLLRVLREAFPHAQITFAVKEQFCDLVRHNPNIDNIIVLKRGERFDKFIKEIGECGFDWMLDIHRNYRSLLVRLRTRIPMVTSYSKHLFKRMLLVSFKINLLQRINPIRLRYFESLTKYGIAPDAKGTEFYPGTPAIENVQLLLEKEGISTNARFVAFCPGASFTNKEWPVEGFISVAKHLYEKYRLFVVLLGSKNDVSRCDEIKKKSGDHVLSFAGKLSLLETGAMLKCSIGAITHDSGLMHMTQALEKPVVAIFGPTVTDLGYAPFGPQAVVVEKDIPCRPCTHNGLNYCPMKHFKCMREITSLEVIEAFERLTVGVTLN